MAWFCREDIVKFSIFVAGPLVVSKTGMRETGFFTLTAGDGLSVVGKILSCVDTSSALVL